MTTPTQAVVLAAGISRRMAPFNKLQGKQQLELMGKPILSWTIESLYLAGISELVVVINPRMKFEEQYWQQWFGKFERIQIIQQKESNGQAGAIVAALPELQSSFFVVNATNCIAEQLLPELQKIESEIGLLCIPTELPWLYGLVTFDAQTGQVLSIAEKPDDSVEYGHRLVGAYRLTREFAEQLSQSEQGDTLLENQLTNWAKQGRVKTMVITEEPPTIKYAWQLLDYKEYLWQKLSFEIHPSAIIAPTAIIRGEVFIGPGAVIGDFAIIDGPAYIGANAVVGQYCVVRKGSVLEAGVQVQRHADVANSIIMANAHVHSGFIGDSIIGQRTTIGAGFVTANRRFDRGEIISHQQGKKIKTGRTYLGVLIGEDCKIGIQVGTTPNVIISDHTLVEPGTTVKRNLGV
jgi:NDP-sugar pyrophosphorylase family protein